MQTIEQVLLCRRLIWNCSLLVMLECTATLSEYSRARLTSAAKLHSPVQPHRRRSVQCSYAAKLCSWQSSVNSSPNPLQPELSQSSRRRRRFIAGREKANSPLPLRFHPPVGNRQDEYDRRQDQGDRK